MALFGRPSERDERRAEAYRVWLRQRNPLAIASVVLGVFSLIEFGALLIFGVAGIVLGVMALAQLRRVNEDRGMEPSPAGAAPHEPGGNDAERRRRNRYEADDTPVPKTEGYRLAWVGIALSALSLVAAAILYTHPWSHGRS